MLLVTDKGLYYTVVEDFDDPDVIWARSQDKRSIQAVISHLQNRFPIPHAGVTYELVDEPSWDYQFRVRLTRPLWSAYLEHVTDETHAHKLKPAVAEARGKLHPVSRMVEEVFYYMSKNRPDGSKPAWLGGNARARR
jgi:hypothetical protein